MPVNELNELFKDMVEKMSEIKLQKEIRDWLRQAGWATARINSGTKGRVKFMSWALPDNWTAIVEPDEVLDIFSGNNVLKVFAKLEGDQSAGFADVIALGLGGTIIFLEVKKPGEKPTPEQKFFLLFMRRMGFTAEIVDSVLAVEKLISGIESERTG